MFKGSGKPSGQMAAFGKQEKKPNPYGKRAKLKMLIKSIAATKEEKGEAKESPKARCKKDIQTNFGRWVAEKLIEMNKAICVKRMT